MAAALNVEYPPKANLRDVSRPLPQVSPGTIDPALVNDEMIKMYAKMALDSLNAAVSHRDAKQLTTCFYEQAYWRDIVAFTSHLRTFDKPSSIVAALLQMIDLRGLVGQFETMGDPHFAVINPSMMFIDCGISFRTGSPELECTGKLVLLPVKTVDNVTWKIWVLSTWVEDLVQYPERKELLFLPGMDMDDSDTIETEVLIVGAGTSGLMTAARLKALGAKCVVVDRNDHVGDSWAKRYDSLKFHVPTSNCEMPYSYYRKELQSPYRLSKDDVAEHLQQYVRDFHLNVVTSAVIQTTCFNVTEKQWTVKVSIAGEDTKTIICKHLVQATGLGSGKPYVPLIKDDHLYQGLRIHSSQYRNARNFKDKGVKTVAVIGSANTAFDVMRDCWEAGLKTTMVARSPTYIFPYDYVMDPHGIGAYDLLPLDAADRLLNTFPSSLDGQFSHGLFAYRASQEPNRYVDLLNAGFPVLDSRDPSVNVLHHLFERGGGHYIDVGGTNLIAEGKVGVRGLVEPVAYTEVGLRLSDESVLEADAVIWCTGFADQNVRQTAMDILGGRPSKTSDQPGLLGPEEISARLDASWGVDKEGEVRGVWKRHFSMENYWVIGGTIQHQRWWSRSMAQQIKLALEGVLPSAYRDTP